MHFISIRRTLTALACLSVAAGAPLAATAQSTPHHGGQSHAPADNPLSHTRIDFAAPIPNIPGKSLKTVIVDYPPGYGSPSHTHAPSAFILAYVLEGSVISAVGDEPERVYTAGQHWTEAPGSHHGVSRNASATEPARLMAIFVVDTTDPALTIPDPQ